MPKTRPERLKAIAANEPTYLGAKPCRNGHTGPRRTSTGKCIECDVARHKRWHAVRPRLDAEWARKRRAKDPTRHRAEVKRWAQKNKDKCAETVRRWKDRHPELNKLRQRISNAVRRAKIRENGGRFTTDDISRMYVQQRGRCAHCKAKSADMEIDHIVPVVRGGSSFRHNLQLLCLPCNRSKGGKDPIEWEQLKGRLL